ncbi:calcium-binding protein [Mesorhizobium sp. CAU 1732]|uniref:calcium-binding protein n=1 Tax=Mesorhizobium sp. CAU 1732 TaxID=3140358 RepID=UPI00326057B7
MTTFYQFENSIGTGVRFTFANTGDEYQVLGGVRVESTDDFAIAGALGNQSVRVDGTVVAAESAIVLQGANNHVTIGSSGIVTSNEPISGNTAIFLTGGNSSVLNEGQVNAASAIGILLQGGDNEVLNRGSITAASGAFLGLFGSVGDTLFNEGSISANAAGDANADFRYNNGVFTEGDRTVIVNTVSGAISAISSQGAGIAIGTAGGDGSWVENRGLVTSQQWFGVDFANMDDGDTARLVNHGTITGLAGAFRGNATAEMIVNRGVMNGDVLLGNGNDTFDGTGGTVNGTVLGGLGNDTYRISSSAIVIAELAAEGTDSVISTATYTLGANIENLTLAGNGDINATGNASANTIIGNGGNNLINGGAGDDVMYGGGGNDIFVVATVADQTIEGLNQGTDTVRAYINWTLGTNVERLELLGSAANGTGNALANTLVGNGLANILNGGDGNDYISASAGNDTLNGGNQNDTLVGGAGADIMNGGAGNDTFLYLALSDTPVGVATRDTINAFVHGEDKINLAAIDANASAAGDQAFSFIGTGNFTGVAGQLRYAAFGNTCLVTGDVNGDSVADFQIAVNNTNFMAGTDFIT